MWRRFLLVAVLLTGFTAFAFSQARPVLGILPFTGGIGGDGEAIATLIAMEPEIMRAFTVVPRTAALNALFAEHYFQLAGLTDSDTIAGIGRMLNADYVLSGNIRRLGDRNLVIATIVNVETFEQVAGYYRTYLTVDEVRGFLPSMSRSMVNATLRRGASRPPSLAMLPFTVAPGVSAQDAETLSKILAIEIINTGDYVVLPRTSTIQAALAEMDFQMMGYTEDEEMAALGRAINADFVLSGGVHRLGAMNLFTAQVLRVRDGSLFAGAARDYRIIADGVDLMAELAILLTDPQDAQARIAALHRRRPAAPRPPRAPRVSPLEDPTRFWGMGISVTSSATEVAVAENVALGFSIHATLAPLRHSFVRIGCDVLFGESRYWYRVESSFSSGGFSSRSITPFVHFAYFQPFANGRAGWYIGIGGGFTMTSFDVRGWDIVSDSFPTIDFVVGLNAWGRLSVSYIVRTNFSAISDRLLIGYTHRFRSRGNR